MWVANACSFSKLLQVWYGTNRICYDFVLRETWNPEIFTFKNAKIQKFHNDYEYLPRPYDMIYIQNLSHRLLVITLSFVKLLWPLLRFSSCTHDQYTRTPTNKIADSYTKKILHSLYHVSLSQKNFMCQRIVWAMLKKEGKNIHAKRLERKKCMPKNMKKRKEKKK